MNKALILCTALLFCPAVAATADPPDARQLLSSSLDPRIEGFTAEQVTQVLGGARRGPGKQRVLRRQNLLRVNYANGEVLFDDGKQQLLYLPAANLVRKSPSNRSPERVDRQRREIRAGRIQTELVREDSIAGRRCWVVSVKLPTGRSRTVWIDRDTSLQLRQDTDGPNGRVISTFFTSLQLDEIPSLDQVQFQPPTGAQQTDQEPVRPEMARRIAVRWGGILEPRELPAGLRFRGYFREHFRGREWLVTVYSGVGGRRALSLFQGPATGMALRGLRRDRLNVVTGTSGGADVILIGPLPPEELRRVKDSLVPAGSGNPTQSP